MTRPYQGGLVETRKRWYAKCRAFVDDAKNAPCMDCGGIFPPYVLDFDHRDPSQKKFAIGQGSMRGPNALRIEIAKCDLVCANCHRERTHNPKEK